jgi:hypothetical protein
MLWGGRWEGGSCLGMHVRIKDFKIKKIKIKNKIKIKKFLKKEFDSVNMFYREMTDSKWYFKINLNAKNRRDSKM